jgi:hypothetical protein
LSKVAIIIITITVIRDYEKGTCMLIDVAIPGDKNVIQKEAEKFLKYTDMWNVKTRKTFDRLITEDGTHNTESTAV